MIEARIHADKAIQAFRRAPQAMTHHVDQALARGALEVARTGRGNAPKAFSTLTQSIHVGREDALHHFAATGVNYARPVEEGVEGPLARMPGISHGLMEWVQLKLQPKDEAEARRLTFMVARSIQRKGLKPQPFMQPAEQDTAGRVQQLVDEAVQRGIKEVFG